MSFVALYVYYGLIAVCYEHYSNSWSTHIASRWLHRQRYSSAFNGGRHAGVRIGYGVTAPFIVANARPEAIFHVIFHSFEVISTVVTCASLVSGASCVS